MSGGGSAPLPPPAQRAAGAPLAPLRPIRRCAAPPRRCRLAGPRPPGSHAAGRGASGAVAVRGAGWAGGSHSGPPARPPLTRVSGAAAASRQNMNTALHYAVHNSENGALCVASLLKAGADASLTDKVSDGAEGRGGEAWGAGTKGGDRGWGGRGPAQAPRRLSAPPSLPPSPPGAAASTSALTPHPVAARHDGVGPRQEPIQQGGSSVRQAPGGLRCRQLSSYNIRDAFTWNQPRKTRDGIKAIFVPTSLYPWSQSL